MLKNLDLDLTKKIDNQVHALVKVIQVVDISILIVNKIYSRSKPGFTLKYKKMQIRI